MNRVAKGYRAEKRCADELTAAGYVVWKTTRVRFCNLDLFGLFDVVAVDPAGKHMLFIQVKSNRVDKATLDDIAALKLPPKCEKWIWIWIDKKGWRKERVK